jgi:adenylosuccinate lyase
MIPRYQTEIMRTIFCDETKYQTWFKVEIAYLEAYLNQQKLADMSLLKRISAKADTIDWTSLSAATLGYEQETRHDVIAFLQALEDIFGEDSRLIHVGLTSSDIVDTALALQMQEASQEISKKLKNLVAVMWQQAQNCRGIMCLGRTHGQAAEPTTFGLKLLSHVAEIHRGHQRFVAAAEDCRVGKLSGAVGVYALTHPLVEQQALTALGLKPETVATQVVARDRHAALFAACATLAGSIERLAVEIRLLMHGQVKEVSEPFHKKQKGSSAMPHKKNPIVSENLTGLMRLIRSYSIASLENQALWHERDISHSSVERVIVPDLFHVLDFAVTRLTDLIAHLVIDAPRMKKNLDDAGDRLLSQAVMLALIEKGLMRQEAYEMVQNASLDGHKSFKAGLLDADIEQYLSTDELETIFSASYCVRHEGYVFDRVAKLIAHM